MLHARIQLLKTYLQNLPPSYLTTVFPPDIATTASDTEINHPILRSIQALLNRIPLLTPASAESFEKETLAQKSDVSLVSLLGKLSNNVNDARELGRKFGIVEHSKQSHKRGAGQWGNTGKFPDDAFGNGQEEENQFASAGSMNGFGI